MAQPASSWEQVVIDLVAERGDALTRYAYFVSGSRDDAADLVQDALVKTTARHPMAQDRAPECRTGGHHDIGRTLELSSGAVKRYLSDGLSKMAIALSNDNPAAPVAPITGEHRG